MLPVIFQSFLLYWATALDLLLILALLYAKFDNSKHRIISLGQILGSLGLVVTSLLLAFVFRFVPEQRILGFLGFIPIAFGLKYLFLGDDECGCGKIDEKIEKRKNKNLLVTVVIISFASCGADNIGLFTPYFVNLNPSLVPVSVLTFFVNIVLLGFLGKALSRLRLLRMFLEKYSRWIMAAVYIGLGLMIVIEAGTLTMIGGWL